MSLVGIVSNDPKMSRVRKEVKSVVMNVGISYS